MRHFEEIEPELSLVFCLTLLSNIDINCVLDRLTRMADDLEDDVEKDDSGLKMSNGIFDAKPRTLSQVIAQAGRPFKKPKVLNSGFLYE